MSIYYFVVGLKPIALDKPAPMSSQEFMKRAQGCLDELVLQDLKRIVAYQDILQCLRHGSLSSDTLWWNYWVTLKNEAHHLFLKHLAKKALYLYAAIADELYGQESTSLEIHKGILDDKDTLTWPCQKRLKKILSEPDPCALERSLIDYFIREIDECVDNNIFSSDQIFAYFYKLIMCERFNSFNLPTNNVILAQFTAPLIERALYEQLL